MRMFIDKSRREKNIMASMLLSGVGDALGYNDGKWEFCHSGHLIQKELEQMGGLARLKPTCRQMIVSDDTVMHIATAEALLSPHLGHDELYRQIARKYKECMRLVLYLIYQAVSISFKLFFSPIVI